jgi:hypothetical protein
MYRVATYLVQLNVDVESVHVLAEFLVHLVRRLHPVWVWMRVPHELREVDDRAQGVAEAVEVLDDLEHFLPRLWRVVHATRQSSCAFNRGIRKRVEGRRR